MSSVIRLLGSLGLICVLAMPARASSPLSGRFYFDRTSHLVGEPLYLTFEVTNLDSKPIRITHSDPLVPCSFYLFQIDGEKRADGTCDGLPGYSCGLVHDVIEPGGHVKDEILLNYYYKFPHPGSYRINARHWIRWNYEDEDPAQVSEQRASFNQDVEAVLKDASSSELQTAFAPYVAALNSTDEQTREQAEEAIAQLAPPFLEGTILDMLYSGDSWHGMVGLRNLNSANARNLLASILEGDAPIPYGPDDLSQDQKSSDRDYAAKYLGEMGDKEYLDLLLKAVEEAPPGTEMRALGTLAIGRLGQERAVPFLVSEAQGETDDQKTQEILALSLTSSREAVPTLIDFLESPDDDVRQVAEIGLQRLTHKGGVRIDELSEVSPAALHDKWVNWWTANGDDAQIFAPDQCGETTILP
jgi:HEAT repeat protein